MNGFRAAAGWLLRNFVLWLLLALAIAFYQFAWPTVRQQITGENIRAEWLSPAQISEKLSEAKREAVSTFERQRDDLQVAAGEKRTRLLAERRERLAEIDKELEKELGLFKSFSPRAVFEREQLKIERQRIVGEISILEGAGSVEASKAKFADIRFPTNELIRRSKNSCTNANEAVKKFNALSAAERRARQFFQKEADRLTADSKTKCSTSRSLLAARDRGLKAQSDLASAKSNLSKLSADALESLENFKSEHVKNTFRSIFLKAFALLIGIIAMPFLIRAIFYYILAPLAERRASIRIEVPGGGSVPIPPAEPSRVSIPITLREGEELLVRQDYLQTSSLTGSKSTRWLLDYRHMLSSIASGLVFLTRVRGAGETTTVSAVRDPFAELTEISLPAGAACVLHPRALVAVVQPVGETIRITSHWRLFSLSAWLTLQLRYMVFHGPGRLIVMGGRGIRIERAERGRIFGQDQLVGFSADLTYSVSRAETFAPYFFGREQLFKDKVKEGGGILIIEEAPLSSRKDGRTKGGVEGVLDAGLKAFGL